LEQNASWYTDQTALPSATGNVPRVLALHTFFVAPADFTPRIRYTLADGSKIFMNMNDTVRTDPDSWGGRGVATTAVVPQEAVSFSLYLTRFSAQGDALSKFADIKMTIVDPSATRP
jgi:hypothetical protein